MLWKLKQWDSCVLEKHHKPFSHTCGGVTWWSMWGRRGTGRFESFCKTPLLSWLINFFLFSSLLFTIMAFAGKYELESQENYVEFLEAVGTRIFYWFIGYLWINVHQPFEYCWVYLELPYFFCQRASYSQDWPQSGDRGGSGWERLHLDPNHPKLDLVQ